MARYWTTFSFACSSIYVCIISKSSYINWSFPKYDIICKYFYSGDENIVETLLLNGASVNIKDKKWLTPLHRACCSSKPSVVNVLLRYKADVNNRDRSWQTPLHVAAANNAVECVELMIPYVLNINVTDRFVLFIKFFN